MKVVRSLHGSAEPGSSAKACLHWATWRAGERAVVLSPAYAGSRATAC